jgi:oligosaccharyltransferase complex subunit beta
MFSVAIGIWERTHYSRFHLPAHDEIQLEFTMLSPFHRLNLQPVLPPPSALNTISQNETIFKTTFTTPDQHGIFAFKVNYKRPWLTNVEVKEQVTVRHFAHDEWPRSFAITGAWPWASGLWVLIAGFVCFVVGWLYCAPPDEQKQRRKAQQ